MRKNRLKEVRESLKLNKKEFAEKLGIKYSTYANYESGLREPASDVLIAVSDIFDISIDYLLGRSDKTTPSYSLELSSAEINIIKNYRMLDQYAKETVRLVINRELERIQKDNIGSCDNLVFMTYYNKLAAAGNGEYLFDDVPTSTIEVPKDLAKDADFVIGVNGDSMEPTFSDGDKVLVKKSSDINIGDIGIFIDGNDCYIKEEGKDCLVSHNKEYGIIPGTDTMRCVGKVLGKIN
ncbi:MAG: helix-turn-helix transcriptional regulator [Clostridiales bacterium]|nr:helix-turn-helix transcriptional regulator [Clostridiales bacterium]MBS5877527.1 helix-turn-helix transcriptional regulator [Clostridiales bacterium]MDU3490047.1 XRE family transcriptional regulator [Clostridiales bacterium]